MTNDLIKMIECQKHGITLIVISKFNADTDWQNIIIKSYEVATGKKILGKPFIHPDMIRKRMQNIQLELIDKLKEKGF